MSVEAIAGKWHDHLLSSEPVNHNRAEAAVQSVYRAAALPEPKRFLWCTSPLEAAWAYLALVGKTDGYNHAVWEDIARTKGGKAALATARALTAYRLGIPDNQVEGFFGKPFYVAESSNPVATLLQQQGIEAWMARAEAGDDFLATHAGGPFKPLHDLEQALHFEGYRGGTGSLYKEALANAANKHLAILGGRSAHHRLYGSFAYGEIALDEALAELGKLQPTELQRAMWAAYAACGMWWPCHDGVVFAERPTAAGLTPDGPRMEWADGFAVGVGTVQSKPAAPPTATAPAPAGADAAILSAALPRDHAARIAKLRKAGGALPHFDRYLAGEHEQVWRELVALGEKVRTDDHAADALAVAYETMHRVDQNVRILANRLTGLGYSFVELGSGSSFFGLGKPRAHDPHVPPAPDSAERIAELEDVAGGPIPLSLRAFFDMVGAVNFIGAHVALSPRDSEGASDPLMVYGIQDAIECVAGEDEEEDGRRMYVVAPDALHKANVSGGESYMIALPAPVADAELEEEPHSVNFVEYLRIAIAWGGFPGWDQGEANIPPELDELRRDIIAF